MTTAQELQVLALAEGLEAIGRHTARMEPDEWHPLCVECATAMLLMRVVLHGKHIAELERTGP